MYLKELDANLVVVLDALLVDSSVTKAAERLGRSPSAVSHALHNLRQIFNDELFVRAGQRLVPTAKALSIAPTVHIVVSGMESLIRPETPFDPATIERSFTIYCSEAQELGLIQKLKEVILEVAPGIVIETTHREQLDLLGQLRSGAVQFVISEDEIEDQSGEVAQLPLLEEQFISLARKSHPLSKKKPTKKQFAAAAHILLAKETGSQRFANQLANLNGSKPIDLHISTSAFGALTKALKSDTLVSVPSSLGNIAKNHMELTAVELPFKAEKISLFMSWHRANERDECHAWIREKITEVAQTIAV